MSDDGMLPLLEYLLLLIDIQTNLETIAISMVVLWLGSNPARYRLAGRQLSKYNVSESVA